MSCWVVVPIKAPADCKTRLRPALGEKARGELVAAMLRHVVDVASDAPGVDQVLLLGPSRHGLAREVPLIADPGGGLNAALAFAAGVAEAGGASRLVIVAADLPRLTSADLQRMTAIPAGEAAIAPDRAGAGTNALSLPLPHAHGFQFRYGPGSFAQHKAEAQRLDLAVREIRSETLGLDIDEPQDLAELTALRD
jgi:2-phospho-L-lactate guanylyltransferase